MGKMSSQREEAWNRGEKDRCDNKSSRRSRWGKKISGSWKWVVTTKIPHQDENATKKAEGE